MAAKEMRQAMMENLGTREYRIRLTEDPEGGFVASIPELPGCLTFGETREEALARMEDAKRCWLAAAREANALDDRGQADRGKMGSKENRRVYQRKGHSEMEWPFCEGIRFDGKIRSPRLDQKLYSSISRFLRYHRPV